MKSSKKKYYERLHTFKLVLGPLNPVKNVNRLDFKIL